MTDSANTHKRSDKTHDKYSVDHSKGEYVREDIHINTAETFFAHLKRIIKGTFKVVSKQHLQSYLDASFFITTTDTTTVHALRFCLELYCRLEE